MGAKPSTGDIRYCSRRLIKVLLGHYVDIRFVNLLTGHEVRHTKAMGWENLSNGKLLAAAGQEGFTAMVTVDKNVRFQQNISKKAISLITLNPLFVDYDYIASMARKLMDILDSGFPSGSEFVIEP